MFCFIRPAPVFSGGMVKAMFVPHVPCSLVTGTRPQGLGISTQSD